MTQFAVAMSHRSEKRRAAFIRKTYSHLLMAVLCFIGIQVGLFQSGLAPVIASFMLKLNWIFILVGFVGVSFLATHFAQSGQSKPLQYLGLGLFTLVEAAIFIPMLYIIEAKGGNGIIESAAIATLAGFAGLTAIAFGSRADFSWMGKIVIWGGIGAMLLVLTGTLFGYNLGTYFSVGMVLLAGVSILHTTSNIMHQYDEDEYIAASLQLFASVALMFFYMLRFMSSRD